MGIIPLRVGDTLPLRASFTDHTTHEPVDMSAWTATVEMNKGECDSSVVPTFEWVDPPLGVGRIILNKDESADLDYPADYTLNLRAESPTGDTISAAPVTIRTRG